MDGRQRAHGAAPPHRTGGSQWRLEAVTTACGSERPTGFRNGWARLQARCGHAPTPPPFCRYLTDVFRVVRSWRVMTRCVSKVGYVGRCVLTLFVQHCKDGAPIPGQHSMH